MQKILFALIFSGLSLTVAETHAMVGQAAGELVDPTALTVVELCDRMIAQDNRRIRAMLFEPPSAMSTVDGDAQRLASLALNKMHLENLKRKSPERRAEIRPLLLYIYLVNAAIECDDFLDACLKARQEIERIKGMAQTDCFHKNEDLEDLATVVAKIMELL